MQVRVIAIDKAEDVVALVATEYKDQFPTIHDPINIANLLHYLQGGGEMDDECMTALKIAEAVLLNISDVFVIGQSYTTEVTLGEPESAEDAVSDK